MKITFKFHNISIYTLNVYVVCFFFSVPDSSICMLDIIGIIDNTCTFRENSISNSSGAHEGPRLHIAMDIAYEI